MAFAISYLLVITSYLLVFLFTGSNTSPIRNETNDETVIACYIKDTTLQPSYDLQYCDHLIIEMESIQSLTNENKQFLQYLHDLREANPNLKILAKITIWVFAKVSIIQHILYRIMTSTYGFDGISLYFTASPSKLSNEWNSQSLFDTYRIEGKLVTLFLYNCGFGNINNVYYHLQVDYIYVICAVDNSIIGYRKQKDVTVMTVQQLIDVGASRSQIVIAINFCPIKYIFSSNTSISVEEGKHDEVCELFNGNHSRKNITSNEIINMYEWVKDDLKTKILFNSPETVGNRVIQSKNLSLAGVMAYKLECDNTEPICLDKVGRNQLFNASRKTKENYVYDYESDGNESVASFLSMFGIILSPF